MDYRDHFEDVVLPILSRKAHPLDASSEDGFPQQVTDHEGTLWYKERQRTPREGLRMAQRGVPIWIGIMPHPIYELEPAAADELWEALTPILDRTGDWTTVHDQMRNLIIFSLIAGEKKAIKPTGKGGDQRPRRLLIWDS